MSVDPPNGGPKLLLFLSSLFLDPEHPEHPERPDTPEYSTGPAWRSVSTVRAAPIPEFSFPAESVQNRRISLNNIKESDRSGLTNGIYGQLQHHLAYSPCRRLLTRCGEDEIDVLALHCSSRAAWCQLSGRVARAEEWLSDCLVGTLDPGLMSVHQLFHAGPFQSDCQTERDRNAREAKGNDGPLTATLRWVMDGNAQAPWGRIRQE